ncbi:MAG: hypothetical protein ABL967_14150 [Bryobacteraceae bacterium]
MPDPNEYIEKEIEIFDGVLQKFRDQGVKWSERSTEDVPFQSLCVQIMNGVTQECHQLKIGVRKALPFAAWAARNLLELRIITAYVLGSKQNATRFINDRYPDGIELFEAIVHLQERDSRTTGIPVDSSPARTTISNLSAEKLKLGLTQKDNHLEMREMARTVGLLDEYLDVNRICSKLVHRTAFSVLAFSNSGEFAYFAPFIFQLGSRYSVEAYTLLEAHITTYGMKPCGGRTDCQAAPR